MASLTGCLTLIGFNFLLVPFLSPSMPKWALLGYIGLQTKKMISLKKLPLKILISKVYKGWREGMGVEPIRDPRQAPYWI